MESRSYVYELKDGNRGYLDLNRDYFTLKITYLNDGFTHNISKDALYDLFIMYLNLDIELVYKSTFVNEIWISINSDKIDIQSNTHHSKESIYDRLKYLFDR